MISINKDCYVYSYKIKTFYNFERFKHGSTVLIKSREGNSWHCFFLQGGNWLKSGLIDISPNDDSIGQKRIYKGIT